MGITRILLSIVLAALLVFAGWTANAKYAGDFRSYQLPNGHSVQLLRNLDQVFPVYAKSFKAEMDLALDQKQSAIKTTAGGKYEQGVQQLYQNLDQINADMRTALVAAYSGLVGKVSAGISNDNIEAAFKKWDDVLDGVIKQTARLREMNLQLAAAQKQTSSGEWEHLIELGTAAKKAADEVVAAAR